MIYLICIKKYLIYNNMDNDFENQMINNQIKKISCVACTIIIGTFVFCATVAYVLTQSYK